MTYRYAHVSTEAQDLNGSTAELKAPGCQKIFREKIGGVTADRPPLKKVMAVLAHGDVAITPAPDRLSHDATDLLVIARETQRAGAGIRSLAEPFLDTTPDFGSARQSGGATWTRSPGFDRPQLQFQPADDLASRNLT